MAIRGLPSISERLKLELTDFFLVEPKTGRLIRKYVSNKGEKIEAFSGFPERLDFVVANPPYIRQENINDKERVRNHLNEYWQKRISNKSDLYIYFITYHNIFIYHTLT